MVFCALVVELNTQLFHVMSSDHVTELIIRHYHEKVAHQGRGITLNEIRSNGIWIIGGSSAVAYFIKNCVTCRRLRGIAQEQLMADLPEDRFEQAAPFTYAAVDYCGPWYIEDRRKELNVERTYQRQVILEEFGNAKLEQLEVF